jgi:ribosomal protein S26
MNWRVVRMANKIRGREKLVTCASCGRTMPKDKSVKFGRVNVYSTELKTADDVKTSTFVENYYCISCGKHRKIFEKLKNRAMRQASRPERQQRFRSQSWNSGRRW